MCPNRRTNFFTVAGLTTSYGVVYSFSSPFFSSLFSFTPSWTKFQHLFSTWDKNYFLGVRTWKGWKGSSWSTKTHQNDISGVSWCFPFDLNWIKSTVNNLSKSLGRVEVFFLWKKLIELKETFLVTGKNNLWLSEMDTWTNFEENEK